MSKPYISLNTSNFSDMNELVFTLVSNSKFQKAWCNFAHFLGFYGARGPGQRIIGANMTVNKEGNNFFIKGADTNDSYLKIFFHDFKLKFIANSIVNLPPRVKTFNPQAISTTNYSNNSDSPINVTKKISFTKSNKTSVSSSNEIINELNVGVDASFNFPGLSKSTSINYTFSNEYTFGNQQDIIETKTSSDQVVLSIEPKNKISVSLLSNTSLAKCDFNALALISFSVTFDGFIRRNKSALKVNKSQNELFPFSYTFGNGDMSALDDIKQQIARKNIPTSSKWNWNIFNLNASKSFSQSLSSIYNGFAFKFSGSFSSIDSSNIVFEIGPNTPI